MLIPAPQQSARPAGHAANVFEMPQNAGRENGSSTTSEERPEIAVADWDDLFSAVKARLRLTVAEHEDGAPLNGSRRIQTSVLECVLALDQLHSTLAQERERRLELEREVMEAQLALAQTIAALMGARAEESRARHLAHHDGLTSLPNRSGFRMRIDRVLAETAAQRGVLSVLYLDLDGFKLINDNHGHAVGDEVLRIVAARLARSVRSEDSVGRLGGDEFACLLANPPDLQRLGALAGKLQNAVAEPMKIGHLELRVRSSIGIAMFPNDGLDADALLKSADAAMYCAKRRQITFAHFDPRAEQPYGKG